MATVRKACKIVLGEKMYCETCEGCRKRAELFPLKLVRLHYVCEICYAKISLVRTRYPALYERVTKGGVFLDTEIPRFTQDELYGEMRRLRAEKESSQYYRSSGITGKPLDQGQDMRPSDDTTPLHPVPLLGQTKEPDALPPQIADNPKLCHLSEMDKILLHGMKTCWTFGDEEQLPKPKQEDEL